MEVDEGAATAMEESGVPLGFALRAYDRSGPAAAPALRLAARARAGTHCGGASCWHPIGTNGAAYRDTSGTPGGLRMLKLRSGAAGAARIVAQGSGPALTVPVLDLALPVTVQLQGMNGECWDADYDTAIANDPGHFKARGEKAAAGKPRTYGALPARRGRLVSR